MSLQFSISDTAQAFSKLFAAPVWCRYFGDSPSPATLVLFEISCRCNVPLHDAIFTSR